MTSKSRNDTNATNGYAVTMQQAQANIAKTQAEAQEEQAKAQLHKSQAGSLQPNHDNRKTKHPEKCT